MKLYNKKKNDYYNIQKEVKLYLTTARDRLSEILKTVIKLKGDNTKVSVMQKVGKLFSEFLEFQDMLAKKIIKSTAM